MIYQTSLSNYRLVGGNLPRRKSYHHGNLKSALVEKALEIIKEEGVAGLSLRKAARRVGVSHAAPAHHFGDLDGLLTAISREGFGLLLHKMDRYQYEFGGGDPLVRLKRICLSYIDFALEHTYYFKVMYSSKLAEKGGLAGLDKGSVQVYQRLSNCVKDCQASGLIRMGDAQQIALYVWTTIHGYATLAVDGKINKNKLPVGDDALAENVIGMICTGLLA